MLYLHINLFVSLVLSLSESYLLTINSGFWWSQGSMELLSTVHAMNDLAKH